jgi:preprotein translocase subunit YajC
LRRFFTALFQRIDLAAQTILMGMHNGWALWLQGSQGAGGLPFILMMAVMVGVFYFLLILPNQRRQKKWQAVLGQLKTGDKVTTSGGLRGTIISLKDDAVTLRIPPDNLKLEVSRGSVVHVTTAEEGKSS